MRKLLLHIGHGKTGSSMLQSSFRLSRSALAAAGITYGAGPDADVTDELQITSGNGTGLLAEPETLARRLAPYARGTDHLLYSSEMLFVEFTRYPDPAALVAAARGAGFDRVEILLFVRDPLGHAASLWQQGVKRSGRTWTIEEGFQQYKMPALVARLVKQLAVTEGIGLTLRNYSVCKNDLLGETCDWLGVPAETLLAPKAERVNRSMTLAELELQLAFNRILGKSGDLISDPLCEKLAHVRSEDIRPSLEVQGRTWRRLRGPMEAVNAFLPAEHHYRRDIRETPVATDRLEFTHEQIDVFVTSICNRIQKLRSANEARRPGPALHKPL